MNKNKTKTINFEKLDNRTRYKFLTTAVAPRPIAFASTVDRNGKVNLSPFSYFNVFSSTPPVMIFSPSRSGRDNTTKDTYDNVKEVPEVVINIVNYEMVEQMSLASSAYEKGVNEFEKSGFTPVKSDSVKPPRVKEAPVAFECTVDRVIELGDTGGAGNLVIARAKVIHVQEKYLNKDGTLDSKSLDQVARMGEGWYCRANAISMFELPKPGQNLGIGVDQLPGHIRNSNVLTGNNIGRLGTLTALPSEKSIKQASENEDVKLILRNYNGDEDVLRTEIHRLGQRILEQGHTEEALAVMMVLPSASPAGNSSRGDRVPMPESPEKGKGK